MKLTFNQWAALPAKQNYLESLLEACVNLSRKISKRGKTPDLKIMLNKYCVTRVSDLKGQRLNLESFKKDINTYIDAGYKIINPNDYQA